ncbi:hypothetical protein C8R28_102444 [Nitrosomonas ureae]|uniref:Uncharacterized protein n=1 Tax=Nitrosomonas ureae TaxID=44577 RepID=A0A2T5IHF1_9PROT|nr:hypothetical protein C8R28_102444 [Nitrosomonas ureae]
MVLVSLTMLESAPLCGWERIQTMDLLYLTCVLSLALSIESAELQLFVCPTLFSIGWRSSAG